MRLVWAVIPLVLIISMIGIIGIQESFATQPVVPKFWLEPPEIVISNIPKLGETAEVTVIFNHNHLGRDIESADGTLHELEIVISGDTLEFVDSSYDTKEDRYNFGRLIVFDIMEDHESEKTMHVTVKSIAEGEASIGAVVNDAQTNILFYTESEQAMLLNDYYEMYPEYLIEKKKTEEMEREKQRKSGLIPEQEPEEHMPKLQIPASFVDSSKNPQIYVDRYNTDLDYKDWFDENFSNYKSIYHAVGLSQTTIILSPRQQMNDGILSYEIICKEGLELVFKQNSSPACVTPATAEKLIERGWAIDEKITTNTIPVDLDIINVVDVTNVVNANNQFAIDFYPQVSQESDENIFFSPWSISTAFAIAFEGAKGNTADEIRQVFGFPSDYQKRTSQFKSVINDLNPNDSEYQLSVANALWLAENFEPFAEYVKTVTNFYDGEVNTVDFGADGIDIINDWVKEKTEEKIEEIFPPGPQPAVQLAITNAIYFKGTWVSQFNPEKTQDGNFWINSDESVTVPMMFLDESPVSIAFLEELLVLEMPYEGEKLSLMILLPNQKDGLEELEDSLSVENISTWKDELREKSIQVMMPKFKLETEYDLVSILETLGIHDAFGAADFSGISNSELFINAAVHKAFVDVNEEGTEAAAATGITMQESAPFTLRVDHPFIFIIQDNETGNILFMGRMVNP